MAIATVQQMGDELADLEVCAIGEDVESWHNAAIFEDTWDGEILSAITEVRPDGSVVYHYRVNDSVAGLCYVVATW